MKLDLYQSQGVSEYPSVVLHPRQVIRRQLVRGRYREIPPDEDGIIRLACFRAYGSILGRYGTRKTRFAQPSDEACSHPGMPRS